MLKPGVDMRSASRAAESSAVSRLTPEEGDVEWAMAVARPLWATGVLRSKRCWWRKGVRIGDACCS